MDEFTNETAREDMDRRQRGEYREEYCRKERFKKLLSTALGAFIGAFLGSYFIVHQFLAKEYLPCAGYRNFPYEMSPKFDEFRYMQKHMKHFKPQNNYYVIISEDEIRNFPFDADEIKDKIKKMR